VAVSSGGARGGERCEGIEGGQAGERGGGGPDASEQLASVVLDVAQAEFGF
jgi:hypothetical protein